MHACAIPNNKNTPRRLKGGKKRESKRKKGWELRSNQKDHLENEVTIYLYVTEGSCAYQVTWRQIGDRLDMYKSSNLFFKSAKCTCSCVYYPGIALLEDMGKKNDGKKPGRERLEVWPLGPLCMAKVVVDKTCSQMYVGKTKGSTVQYRSR